jgi:acyl carrier protein
MPVVTDAAGRLARCFALVFPDLSRDEIAGASVESVASWDSVAAVTLVSVVGEEFGVVIDPELLDQLVSFDQIREHLERQPA